MAQPPTASRELNLFSVRDAPKILPHTAGHGHSCSLKDRSGCCQNPEKFSGCWAPYEFRQPLWIVSRQKPYERRANKSVPAQESEAQALWEGWSFSEGQQATFSVAGRWSAWPWSLTIGTHTSLSLRRESGPMTGKVTETSSQLPSKGKPQGPWHGEMGAGSGVPWAMLEYQLCP